MLFFCVTLVDYRVQPLVMLVKKWAKKHDINDASCGTLSSYALTLMVLHYLQGEIVTKCCPVFFNVHVIMPILTVVLLVITFMFTYFLVSVLHTGYLYYYTALSRFVQ